MSIIDKALAAVTPPESDQKRAEATAKARAAAAPGDWLSLALDHHDDIRAAFAACKAASGAADRTAAQKRLALALNAHVVGEEVVLYPALAHAGEKAHATLAYTEQAAAKVQMGELEGLSPTSKDWEDKLGHIEGAVLHHIYEEESGWFLELKEKGDRQDRLTERYAEEYGRYAGSAAA